MFLRPRYDGKKGHGKFADILNDDIKFPFCEDYMAVIIEDDMPILDVHGQLEKKYPNLMQVERLNLMQGDMAKSQEDYRTKSEEELFATFFEQMTGNKLVQEQSKELNDTLEELLAQEREAKI